MPDAPEKAPRDEEPLAVEEAARELTALTEDLGLYQEAPGLQQEHVSLMEKAGYALPVSGCPFCGAPMPCTAHRAGG